MNSKSIIQQLTETPIWSTWLTADQDDDGVPCELPSVIVRWSKGVVSIELVDYSRDKTGMGMEKVKSSDPIIAGQAKALVKSADWGSKVQIGPGTIGDVTHSGENMDFKYVAEKYPELYAWIKHEINSRIRSSVDAEERGEMFDAEVRAPLPAIMSVIRKHHAIELESRDPEAGERSAIMAARHGSHAKVLLARITPLPRNFASLDMADSFAIFFDSKEAMDKAVREMSRAAVA